MALASFRQTLVGGKMTNKAAEQFVKLGLIDPAAVIKTKTGSVKGVRPGGIVGADLASENPFEWVQKYLKPALDKKGITDPNRISEMLAHLFGNRFSEQMANILLNQQQRILKDRGLIEHAPGSEATDKLRAADPKVALMDLAAGLNSFLSALGSPLAGRAAHVMNALADSARYLGSGMASIAKHDPLVAGMLSGAAVGGLGYVGIKGMQSMFGMFTGATALKGSAAALSSSAAALDAAALRLGGAGAVDLATKVAGGAAGIGVLAGGVGVATLLAGAALQADVMTKYPEYFDTDNPYAPNPVKVTDVPRDFESSMSDFVQAYGLASSHRGGIGSDSASAAQAELTGSASIDSKITVEPSPDFITRIETMISNAIHGISVNGAPPVGTSGSTGISMPESSGPYP